MGKATRKKYTPEFKAKVAIEALKEQSTLAELAKKYEVSPTMISHWKAELVNNAGTAFGKGQGYIVGRKLIRRLMALMGIRAIYPMKSLSKGGWYKYRMPYLLRHLDITRPNQVWSTDISYIAMEHGFMYLYAIIDVYSRCIVGWGLYNTLDAANAIEVLENAIRSHGAPEIINSDQGCQYTSKEWLDACGQHGIKVSMDGRARCLDNIWIERFWRTLKREQPALPSGNRA